MYIHTYTNIYIILNEQLLTVKWLSREMSKEPKLMKYFK